MFNLKSFIKQCHRVWSLLSKPSKKEFQTIAKISAMGLSLIGLIGFIIALILIILKIK